MSKNIIDVKTYLLNAESGSTGSCVSYTSIPSLDEEIEKALNEQTIEELFKRINKKVGKKNENKL